MPAPFQVPHNSTAHWQLRQTPARFASKHSQVSVQQTYMRNNYKSEHRMSKGQLPCTRQACHAQSKPGSEGPGHQQALVWLPAYDPLFPTHTLRWEAAFSPGPHCPLPWPALGLPSWPHPKGSSLSPIHQTPEGLITKPLSGLSALLCHLQQQQAGTSTSPSFLPFTDAPAPLKTHPD